MNFKLVKQHFKQKRLRKMRSTKQLIDESGAPALNHAFCIFQMKDLT